MFKEKLNELLERYELELERIAGEIESTKAKLVLLQFPDGLKQYAPEIKDYLDSKYEKTNFIIWLGTCFGACDFPTLNKEIEDKIDLIIQFGHNELMPSYISK